MYNVIKNKKPALEIYTAKLIEEGTLTKEDVEEHKKWWSTTNSLANIRIWGQLEDTFAKSKDYKPTSKEWLASSWNGFASPKDLATEVLPHLPTSVEVDLLKEIGTIISSYPKDFNVHPNLKRIIAGRGKSVIDDTGVDMSTAEALAFGTLVKEGYHVRVSGQDVERGTFSQRHAVLHDQKTESAYIPLMHVKGEKPGSFSICNSSLSEYGVMGFEYGYSLSSPEALVMCEMQFGDFANVCLRLILLTVERSMYYRSIHCLWRGKMATTFRTCLVIATRL